MKSRIWLGGLLLSLCGWSSNLFAQDALWKRATRPAPVALAKPESGATPAVTLGKPVPLQAGDLVARPVPGAIVPVVFEAPMRIPLGASASGAPLASGAESLPTWPDEEDTDESRPSAFAVDRAQGRPGIRQASTLPAPGVSRSFVIARSPQGSLAVGRQEGLAATELPPPQPLPTPIQWMPGVNHDAWAPALEVDPLRKHFYVSAEYLYWWTKHDHVPVLVTTGDPNSADPNDRFGFLGQPSTQVLFGGDGINGGGTSGFRVTTGCWLDMYQEEGLEVSGFLLGGQGTHFRASSADFPVLARPFLAANSNTEFSQLVAFPGIATGNVSIDTVSQLWGIEANLRCNLFCCCDRRIDLFGGFRYLDLVESINIVENIQGSASAPGSFANTQALVFDRFATHNSFYGGQIGLDSEWRWGRWFLDVKGKLGIGGTTSEITINGGQTFFNPDGSIRSAVPGGLLALNSNSGKFHKDHFSFVPEITMNLGYQLTDNIRVFAGYNFLYWTGVIRPGDQIDRSLDVNRIPNFPVAAPPLNTIHPTVPFKTTDFWATGVNVGIEFRY
jgi:hypothetical protein